MPNTRRLLARHGLASWKASYDEIQRLFMEALPKSPKLYNEYHALVVAAGKELCKKHPDCHLCPLRRFGKLQLELPALPVNPR